MAWNKNLPANSTKLRLSPAIFQANWAAIEDGSVPFRRLKIQNVGTQPLPETGYGFVYVADPGSGFTELFYRDDRAASPGNTVRLTNKGGVGSASRLLYGSGVVIGSGSYENNQSSFVSAWAKFSASSSGTVSPSYGFNIADRTRSSTGVYIIRTDAVFSNANVAVSVIATTGAANSPWLGYLTTAPSYSGGVVSIPIQIENRNGTHEDLAFHIIVMGGI